MNGIEIGNRAEISKTFNQQEVSTFAELSLDFNPIHLDSDYAQKSVFGKKIVHGSLVSSLFSGLMGMRLPGEGAIYLGQDIRFLKPIYIGENIIASVEVIDIREDKPIITLSTTCVNEQGETLITGTATVLFPNNTLV